MSQKVTFWFVEPSDATSNQVITSNMESVEECHDVLCEDGNRRNMYPCDYDFITKLRRSKKKLGIDFKVFVKEGLNGKVRFWKL